MYKCKRDIRFTLLNNGERKKKSGEIIEVSILYYFKTSKIKYIFNSNH